MSKYETSFLRKRMVDAWDACQELSLKPKSAGPQKTPGRLRVKKASKAVAKQLACDPKKKHRARYLRLLFLLEGKRLGAILASPPVKQRELYITEMYGIDALGPFKERLEKLFLRRGKRLVRRRVSVEELLLTYPNDDPDVLINDILHFIANAINDVEGAWMVERNRKQSDRVAQRGG
ncbi:MAG: hypothetical protein KBD27_03895 [Candidatus Moranbacteria bacterium]|nr:hypothetical protein [Candidatus Moranbacteria bacterium]